MKKALFSLCLFICFFSIAISQVINYDQLEKRSRVAYLKGTDTPFSGTAKSFYKNGAVKNDITFAEGLKEGNYKVFYESGKIKSVKLYKQNKLEGEVIVWYETGQFERKVMFSSDKKNGLFQSWYENGQIKSKGLYINNKKTGIHTGWYDNGNKESEGNFVDDSEDGTHSAWYENGQLASQIIYKAGEKGDMKYWTKEGKLMTADEVQAMLQQQNSNLMQMWMTTQSDND